MIAQPGASPAPLAAQPAAALYRRFAPYLRPYRRQLALALAAALTRPGLNAAKVWLLKIVIDDVVRAHRVELLLPACAGYLAIALAKGVTSYAHDQLAGSVGAHVVRDLRAALYERLQGLSLTFFHGQRLGDLLTRLTGDTSAIEDFLVTALPDALAQAATVVVFAGMLFYLDSSLGLIALAVVPLLAFASLRNARRARPLQAEIREQASALTSVAEEGLSAIALVKAFAREPFERARFAGPAERGLRARLRAIRLRALYAPLVELIATVGTVLVVWLGVQAILSGRLTLGGLVVFLGYLGALYAPIQGLSRLTVTVQRALVGAARVAEVLDAPSEHQERRLTRPLRVTRGLVNFRDVTFGYAPDRPVLRGLNLTIRPGEMVALVGASGAGKTTVVSLLLAYYDASSGTVTIDGQDLRQMDPRSVRENVAAVLQEPMLFQASVRENLRYGRLNATDAEIEDAARAAGADAFIAAMPGGYDAGVGPRGGRLSGGQRQRLALARALLKDAPIVVLDEATSALDPTAEIEVLRAARARWSDRAILLVAHRLAAVRQADRIALVADGRVAELGTHDELVQRDGLYRRFYLSQVGHAAAEELDAQQPSPASRRLRSEMIRALGETAPAASR